MWEKAYSSHRQKVQAYKLPLLEDDVVENENSFRLLADIDMDGQTEGAAGGPHTVRGYHEVGSA
jgi:hypothetical protein